jgi:hypothetical protein
MDISRRTFFKSLAALSVAEWAQQRGRGLSAETVDSSRPKVIVLSCGGVRRQETFGQEGVGNIPHLYRDLLPKSTFFTQIHNLGVTSHYNTISSYLTGNWQHVDDWGKTPPESPTIFEYARKELGLPQDDVWFISSNKALTSKIGASAVRDFGPSYGANVIFPKQMLINAVVNAAAQGRAANNANRGDMQAELQAMLQSSNYEGLGWQVEGGTSALGPTASNMVLKAIDQLVKTNVPISGDEFTYLMCVEVMKRFAPSLMVMTFSDVEAAHFGSYSMHLAGIRTLDRLVQELWAEIEADPNYRGKTTLLVLPEFGRDFDGSPTNGFFNHRQDSEETRSTWMMAIGAGARSGQVVDRPIKHVDISATVASLLGLKATPMQGTAVGEIRL